MGTLQLSAPAGLSQEDELHWLALRLVQGLGPRKAFLLLERFRTPQAIFRASRSELEICGINGAAAQSIASGCSFEDAAGQQQKLREAGAVVVPLGDSRYPELLRHLFDPPVVLFARGNVELLNRVCFAVIGTRRPTPYGLAVAERFSGDLARAGLVITSGMARGIDSTAHKGALAAQGPTIAVLGCGVDIVYPLENKKLAAEIVNRGLIVSEFPMGSPAYPQNFPIRNRIISGLSAGLLVVEGGQYSGSAITAQMALEQGRELFAIPGNITSKVSWGPNLLIKQGAHLAQEWTDILNELPSDFRRRLANQHTDNQQLSPSPETIGDNQASLLTVPETKLARELLRRLKPDQAIHLDALLDTMEEYSTSEVIAALFDLELQGAVNQLPGKNFVRVW
jgi:DNA processing protein